MIKPTLKPDNAHFSSGPCKKHSAWSVSSLKNAAVSRSHRSNYGYEKIKQALSLTAEILEVPSDYHIAIVPGSDTGAMEMAMWNLLGAKTLDILVYEYFAEEWLYDVRQQLKLNEINCFKADFGEMPDISKINFDNDFLFVLNGTSLGMALLDLDFIPEHRKGLTICDASAAAFSQRLNFSKLDVVTFSWQKVLGGEAAHGVIILSPKAIERLETYSAPWAIPKILRLKKTDGSVNYELFKGKLLNTPSMLCIEDYIISLLWVKSLGGTTQLIERIAKNAKIIKGYVDKTTWLDFLIKNPNIRAPTTQTLTIIDKDILKLNKAEQSLFLNNILAYLEDEHIAYDIAAYRKAPLGLRIWTGATIETKDLERLCDWLDYAFFTEKEKIIYKFL